MRNLRRFCFCSQTAVPCERFSSNNDELFETNAGIGTERSAKTEDRYFHSLLEYSENYSVYPDRWNKTAGPESIKANYHKNPGANFIFGSGRVTFVKPEEFHSLKWQPSESSSPQD